MSTLHLPSVETLTVDDLVRLPRGHRYELHDGNLVIAPPGTFWHQGMMQRVLLLLLDRGFEAFTNPGVRGGRPRDSRIPDLGVLSAFPADVLECSHLPASAYPLVVEIVSGHHPTGEYTHRAHWYAEQGIPEYWIVDRAPEDKPHDAQVHQHRLTIGGPLPAYVRERSLLLSELENEYRAEKA
ncbi:Uma2 family endonuclease [Symbioplanes lichenis]|uniref:Uma2 family endonuclease n=1 Tax=Symbioplanes lichenis TaxID=1629072 RepID=UPI002739FBC5|nr:Uma2 family endonuclease [Actinoplanes lichenis]